MQDQMIKKLIHVKSWLMVAMMLLIVAEFGFILSQVFNYIWAIIGALLILAVRIGFYKYQDNKSWQQRVLIGITVIGILGPVVYFIYKIVFVDSSPLWISVFLSVSFLIPVVILYFVNRTLTRLIASH